MDKKINLLVLIILLHCNLYAQLLPKEGSNLNYRLVGFSFPQVQKVNKYTIEIASGHFYNEDSFKKNIVQTVPGKNSKIVAEVPAFGRQYTWRSSYTDPVSKTIVASGLHHFSTATSLEVDTNSMRLRIINAATKYKDAYIFLDGMRALYDMNGRPVWFLPHIERFKGPPMRPMPVVKNVVMAPGGPFIPSNDLKITPQGTITFIYFETAYEIDYNGKILWSAPDQDKTTVEPREFYHHEFTRLANGNYLALKNEFVTTWWKWERRSETDSVMIFVPSDEVNAGAGNFFSRKTELAVINEYDTSGKVVWSWHSSRYFIDEDKGKEVERSIRINRLQPNQQEVHANSVYFNERDSTVYIGFRNTSRIIKIRYPSGQVLNVIGDDRTFCYQHSAHLLSDNNLYMFNNNLCRPGGMPEVLIMKQPVAWQPVLQPVWNYRCTYEAPHPGHDHGAPQFVKGGNAIELPDHSIFVNMGSNYSKLFIVGMDKKILWSALPERYEATFNEWENVLQYKASIIPGKKELEKLIWNAETTGE